MSEPTKSLTPLTEAAFESALLHSSDIRDVAHSMVDHGRDMEKQRDALLAALERMMGIPMTSIHPEGCICAYCQARAAIAATK